MTHTLTSTAVQQITWVQNNIVYGLDVSDVHANNGIGGRFRITLQADPDIDDSGDPDRLDLATVVAENLVNNNQVLTIGGIELTVESADFEGTADGVGATGNNVDALITFTSTAANNSIQTGFNVNANVNDVQRLRGIGFWRYNLTDSEYVPVLSSVIRVTNADEIPATPVMEDLIFKSVTGNMTAGTQTLSGVGYFRYTGTAWAALTLNPSVS